MYIYSKNNINTSKGNLHIAVLMSHLPDNTNIDSSLSPKKLGIDTRKAEDY